MIRILDRLVAFSFLRVFLAFILGAPILFILGDITENLEGYLDRELTGLAIAKAYLFMLPQFIQWAFPIAALVAVVFVESGHRAVQHHQPGLEDHRAGDRDTLPFATGKSLSPVEDVPHRGVIAFRQSGDDGIGTCAPPTVSSVFMMRWMSIDIVSARRTRTCASPSTAEGEASR